jgi:general stress protein YciG
MNKVVRRYLAKIGRKGGKAITEKKSEAARQNGLKGGRPEKQTVCESS